MDGFLYFVKSKSSNQVNVGFAISENEELHLQQIKGNSHKELVVLGKFETKQQAEKNIQALLHLHHIRGNWFEYEPTVAVLERLKNKSSSYQPNGFHKQLLSALESLTLPEEEDDLPLGLAVAYDIISDWVDVLRQLNTEMPLPLRSWLGTQKKRSDPIGDLSQDTLNDPYFPATGSLETYLSYIQTIQNKDSGVTRTLLEAWIECDMEITRII